MGLQAPLREGDRKMAYQINQETCVGCGSCAGSCPVEAIAADGDKYKIDADKCVDCGSCAGSCPVEAIAQA